MYKTGTASDNSYMVSYDEVAFKAISEDDLADYAALWELEAEQAGCRYLAVRVVPDALFGDGKPYIAIQKDFNPAPWSIKAIIVVELREGTAFGSVREQVMSRLRAAYGATKTHYKIVDSDGMTAQEGYL
jgi:hypothetical protein